MAWRATKALAKEFNVLALESSADDTCVAIVTSTRKILSNVVIKQNDVHEGQGGIHPLDAMEAHQRNMPGAVRRALDDAGLDISRDIDGIAFTRGPGMRACLAVGMNAAKSLAAALQKPLVGVHHMQGHALTPLLTSWPHPPKFPFLTLLVSGGHTLLLLAKSPDNFKILATTQDESVGRSFDKVSRLLGLKWTELGPGDALEKFCTEDSKEILPSISLISRPFAGQLQFSFSGLHSSVKQYIDRQTLEIDIPTKRSLARAFQTAAVAQLEEKLLLALEWCKTKDINLQEIVVSGGVASNKFLRERLRQCLLVLNSDAPPSLVFPPSYLCTGQLGEGSNLANDQLISLMADNAVMIGWASMYRFLANDTDQYDLDLLPKWSIEELMVTKT